MKRLSFIITMLLLQACATEAKYKQMLDTFKGADELNLIRQWGPPDQTYEYQGHRFFVYKNNRTMTLPGAEPMYQTTFAGKTAYTQVYGGYPATSVNLYCATTFEIVDGKVLDWSFRGSDCTAK